MKKLLLILFAALSVNAANITWLGTTASAKTATNWVGGVLPATTDTVVFGAVNLGSCTFDSNFTLSELSVNSSYTGTLTISSLLYFNIGTSRDCFVISGTPSITSTIGSSFLIFHPTNNDIAINVPALTTNGVLSIAYGGATYNATFNFTGKQKSGKDFYMVTEGTNKIVFNLNMDSLIAPTLFTGSLGASGTNTVNYRSCIVKIGAISHSGYSAGVDSQNLQTSSWFVSGGWNFNASQIITGTAATQSITFSGAGTTTSNGKTFPGNVINNAVGTLRTMADKFRCIGNFTNTHGSIIFASLARDSIGGDYANNLTGTDTLNRNNDSLWVGGSFTGNLRVKNALSRTYFYGTALCNMTTNGTTVNYDDIRGTDRTKQMKCIDRYHGRKLVVTTGTLNTNGKTCITDSFTIVNDSIATVLGDTISSRKITLGASAKPINGTPLLLYFGLALKDTLFDTMPAAKSAGKLVVNKSGDTLTSSGVGHFDTMQIIAGGYRMGTATDTQYTKGLSWTSTAPATIIAPIVVTDSIYIAAGASITYSGTGKIIKLACSAAQGGNAVRIYYPTISPITYPNSSTLSDTLAKPKTYAMTYGCLLGRDSIKIVGAGISGYTVSNTTGTISWSGIGSPTTGSLLVRGWFNGTDSASVTVTVGVVAAPVSGHRRRVMGLGLGLGMF